METIYKLNNRIPAFTYFTRPKLLLTSTGKNHGVKSFHATLHWGTGKTWTIIFPLKN